MRMCWPFPLTADTTFPFVPMQQTSGTIKGFWDQMSSMFQYGEVSGLFVFSFGGGGVFNVLEHMP